MQDSQGNLVTDKEGIANVFADFYAELYRALLPKATKLNHEITKTPDPITQEELANALKQMKRGKASDEAGVAAEMLKDASQSLHDAVLDLFNEVLSCKLAPPEAWTRTRLTVIYKKGDAALPANYRPIAVLSVFYKLFSRILCDRLVPFIAATQTVEQAAYRKGFSTVDHMLTVTLALEKSSEFRSPLWLGLVDFEKAFDSVEHEALWAALSQQNVPTEYIALLQRLYEKQVAFVRAGADSRNFCVERGVKQGDPISGLLFIAALQACFQTLNSKWANANLRRKGFKFGIDVYSCRRRLTEIRFADDVVLFAKQRSDITKMLSHLSVEAAKFGLRINFDKTKVLTWNDLSQGASSVNIGGRQVEILEESVAERYLGRKISCDGWHEAELSNRIAAAWAAFHKHKAELCGPSYRLHDRVRLFNSVVSPVVLYGSAVWALKLDMENRLRTAWRRMLRYVFRVHRRPVDGTTEMEPWVDFVQRAARRVETMAEQYGLESWVQTHRRMKWRLAGKLVRQTDCRWSKMLLDWRPASDRGRGRPKLRWTDHLERYAGGNWRQLAHDEGQWNYLENGFANYVGS